MDFVNEKEPRSACELLDEVLRTPVPPRNAVSYGSSMAIMFPGGLGSFFGTSTTSSHELQILNIERLSAACTRGMYVHPQSTWERLFFTKAPSDEKLQKPQLAHTS